MLSGYQMSLPPRTPETAEPRSRAVLDAAQARLGFIPNMYGVMANPCRRS